ncbi:uncharacterized protein LOC111701670 isoform X2 [Eurytemora carolleeae]|uniref:uncharacterized protein LOC111701670 isoform X2 n=1 Tax=Eurytemora carolleeae TaxID=1294199 RepID=UPI000C772787|nr:uncharacterized protein LOC111701670 isoform X2 [Eurytemora carolleeae]|eukprot:XP_023328830.1 uncharacterized protein LOC111701670 isoform X2 [Eurytemora affinis]
MSATSTPLPPGWDMKYDSRTSRYYYINHYTKTTSWEDPREKYQQIGKPTTKDSKENQRPTAESGGGSVADTVRMEHISLQEYRARAGSPGGRAGTPQQAANQSVPGYYHGMVSPQPLGRLQQLQLEESGGGVESPLSQRSLRRDSHILAELQDMENTFTNIEQALIENDDIKNKRYHGSQAVVISALQVAKHPISTVGPASVYTPLPSRHATLPGVSSAVLSNLTGSLPYNFQHNMTGTPLMGIRDISSIEQSSGYPTPRPGTAASDLDTSYYMGSPQISANLFRSFPKPHSSPKMKLRYLKSVFPTVEEYLLLDVLANSENNVQKATDRLVKMGYVKRDAPSAPRLHAKKKEEERLAEKRTPLPKPPPIQTEAEKETLRQKMKEKYEVKFEIPERILFMALESVLYDEEQANNLITAMIEDDLKRQKQKEAEKAKERAERKKSPKPVRKILEIENPKSPKHEPKKAPTGKGKRVSGTSGLSGITEDLVDADVIKPSLAKGPNPSLRKGPNDDLLLTDYTTWTGPNPTLRKGSCKENAAGPNPANRKGPKGSAMGPNPANRRGPQVKVKGSMIPAFEGEPTRSF